jgi:hypothetical protein
VAPLERGGVSARPVTARPGPQRPGPRPAVSGPAADVDHLAAVGCQLAARIRDEGPEDVAAWLLEQLPDPADRWRLLFVLAAAVPVDVPWLTLTSWAHDLDPAVRPTRPAPAEAPTIDTAALERACAGEPVRLRPRDRRVVVDRLTAQGMTARQIAARLGVTIRAVQRHRELLRAARAEAATPQQQRQEAA